MSFSPRPCAHCGGVAFQVLPTIQLEIWQPVAGLGASAGKKLGRAPFTMVVCNQCGLTQTFAANLPELMQLVPGAHLVRSGVRR